MNNIEYRKFFDDILEGREVNVPYNNQSYVDYVKLNKSRTHRWDKKGILTEELSSAIKEIDEPQNWVLITEPWCGDAANSVPLIEKMAELNPNVNLTIQLRDSGSEIDNYLTNGAKSIPKLIVRDEVGNDLFTWGPRPKEAQELVIKQKGLDLSADEKYANVLKWYLKDKGQSIQSELMELLRTSTIQKKIESSK